MEFKIGQVIKIHSMDLIGELNPERIKNEYFNKHAVINDIQIDYDGKTAISISIDGKEKGLKIYPEIDDIEIVKDFSSKEFLRRKIDEFNSMTPQDALEELNSWDFYEAFGSDAERLSDAIKRLALLVEEIN